MVLALYLPVLGLGDKALVAGGGVGYRAGFCEKLLKASPISDRANVSCLQDKLAKAEAISRG